MLIFASREEFFIGGVVPVTLSVGSTCCICLEEFAYNSENPVAFTTCGHIFGSRCVAQLRDGHCPLCRAILWEDASSPSNDLDEDDFSEEDEYSQESDHNSYDEDDDDEDDDDNHDDDDDYDEYYDDYGYDYDEGETPDDSDVGMPDIDGLSIDDPDFDSAAADHDRHRNIPGQDDPRLYASDGRQASERPAPIDMVRCVEFIQAELDNDAMEVTVRRLPMVWAWRDFMSYCGVEGVLAPAVRQRTGLGDERAAARTLALVEREALPAIEAWMARREGRVWEVHALRQAWVAEGAGRLGPEVVEFLWLLSGIVLAWRLGREVEMFAESP